MLSATKVDENWLAELAPHFFAREDGATAKAAARLKMQRAATTMGEAAARADDRDNAAVAGGRGVKRRADDEQGSERARQAPPTLSVAAMLGESLLRGGGL